MDKQGDEEFKRISGIKGLSIFARIGSTVDLAKIFTPCVMHALHINFAKYYFRHVHGTFTPKAANARIGTVDAGNHRRGKNENNSSNGAGDGAHNSIASDASISSHSSTITTHQLKGRKRKSGHNLKPSSGRQPKQKRNKRISKDDNEGGGAKRAKFVETDDPYNVKPADWIEVGRDCDKTKADFPVSFGSVHNFAKHCHNLKATDWRTWFKIAPLLLYKRMDMREWQKFKRCCVLMTDLDRDEMTEPERENMEIRTVKVLKEYEETFYR